MDVRASLVLAVFFVNVFQSLLVEGSILPPEAQILVVGGQDARPGQFPWQAWLMRYSLYRPAAGCGGSLISDQHVLTAAHCVTGGGLFRVELGVTNRASYFGEKSQRYWVYSDSVVVHPNYNELTVENDIAIITLGSRVIFRTNVQPIKLPVLWEGSNALDGQIAVVSGFGQTTDAERTTHPVLQHARLRILQHNQCEKYYLQNFNFQLKSSQICTTYIDNIAGTCSGDSGGPLVVNDRNGIWTLVGIVSLGIVPCEKGHPSVYTAVAYYLSWIKEVAPSALR